MAAEEGRDLLLRRFTAKSRNYVCDLFADALCEKERGNDDAEDNEKKRCCGAEIGGSDLSCKPMVWLCGDDSSTCTIAIATSSGRSILSLA